MQINPLQIRSVAASRHPIRWRAKIWWREAREALSGQAHQKELTVKDKTISEKDSEILRLKDQLAAMSEKRDLEMNAAVTEKDREIAALKATIDQNAQALEIALLKERQQAKEATQAKDV